MDGEVEVAAVKFVLGRHFAAVAPSRGGLSISDVQLKQVDLQAGVRARGKYPPAFSPLGVQLTHRAFVCIFTSQNH
jgi:hypothetical protein